MKRIFKCTFLLAALGASTFASCKGGEGGSPAVRATATPPTVSAPQPAAPPTALASSPDFTRELDRRRIARMQQQASQEENKMTPERVRKMEMSRLELTSLSQEAAAASMGLGEGDRSMLRRALIDFRDATLFRIEHPDARVDARGPDVQPYQLRQRKLLGDARYDEFSRLEQQEREKLIAGRRAFRKSAAAPTASQPGQ